MIYVQINKKLLNIVVINKLFLVGEIKLVKWLFVGNFGININFFLIFNNEIFNI